MLGLTSIDAQVQTGKKQDKSAGMGMSGMQSCMEQIASDSTMRMQMMTRMMESTKGDSTAMMQMCRKMMGNSDMHRMVMKLLDKQGTGTMEGMGGKMKDVLMDQDDEKKDTVLNTR